jgi:hypothetical protein
MAGRDGSGFRLASMRTYVRVPPAVPPRQGPPDAGRAADDARRDRGAARAAEDDRLVPDRGSASAGLDATSDRRAAPGRRTRHREVRRAAPGGIRRGSARLRRVDRGADVSRLRRALHRRGLQAQSQHRRSLQLRSRGDRDVESLDPAIHSAQDRLFRPVSRRSGSDRAPGNFGVRLSGCRRSRSAFSASRTAASFSGVRGGRCTAC